MMQSMLPQQYNFSDQQGLSLLVIIVIVSMSMLVLSLGASLMGLGELEMSTISNDAHATQTHADGCAEEALVRLRDNEAYPGGSFTYDDGSCAVSVSSSGSNRTLFVTSTRGVYVHALQLEAVHNGNTITVTTWDDL